MWTTILYKQQDDPSYYCLNEKESGRNANEMQRDGETIKGSHQASRPYSAAPRLFSSALMAARASVSISFERSEISFCRGVPARRVLSVLLPPSKGPLDLEPELSRRVSGMA
jgi:hypothetical protein